MQNVIWLENVNSIRTVCARRRAKWMWKFIRGFRNDMENENRCSKWVIRYMTCSKTWVLNEIIYEFEIELYEIKGHYGWKYEI